MDTNENIAASETTAAAPTAPALADAAPAAEANVTAAVTELPAAALLPEAPLTAAPAPAIAAAAAAPAPAATVEPPSVEPPMPPKSEAAPIQIEDVKPAAVEPMAPATKPGIRQYALLAAALTLAVGLGALAGATAAVHFAPAPPPPAAHSATADQALALKASVAQLGRELASVKNSIDAISRSTASQFKTIAERLDRTEKAQIEPAAKLAKISESLDRLERRVAAPAPAAKPTDVTGSVSTVDKHPTKPPTIDGWTVIDVYAGRAVLQSRAGALYEIGPGSNLPGVGRIEQIKREDGRIVVVTPKGIITAQITAQAQPSLPRRPPYYGPYRY